MPLQQANQIATQGPEFDVMCQALRTVFTTMFEVPMKQANRGDASNTNQGLNQALMYINMVLRRQYRLNSPSTVYAVPPTRSIAGSDTSTRPRTTASSSSYMSWGTTWETYSSSRSNKH